MSEASLNYAQTWKKPHFIKSSLLRYLIYVGTVTYFFLAIYTMDVNWTRVAEGIPRGADMISKFFPPDLSDSRGVILDGILESIWMAVISTIGGVLLSIPIGLGAARNLAPTWVYLFCRSIIAVSRAAAATTRRGPCARRASVPSTVCVHVYGKLTKKSPASSDHSAQQLHSM